MSAGVVVVTGGSAGVGRATVEAFAQAGWDVGIIARGQRRLDATVATVERMGRRACAVSADVADADAVERAADTIEQALGPIDVWVNNAMATVFGPVSSLTADEFHRGTEVTYLGQVHGTMAALKRMRTRNRGTIVNVGSALSYRAIPLQSIYCGAKYAVRGFTDALRSELLHDGVAVHLTMVHLAAMNTPQFDWSLNKMRHRPQPVPPIFSPDVAARAILFAATHRRREIWVGFPTLKTILAAGSRRGWLIVISRRQDTAVSLLMSRRHRARQATCSSLSRALGGGGTLRHARTARKPGRWWPIGIAPARQQCCLRLVGWGCGSGCCGGA